MEKKYKRRVNKYAGLPMWAQTGGREVAFGWAQPIIKFIIHGFMISLSLGPANWLAVQWHDDRVGHYPLRFKSCVDNFWDFLRIYRCYALSGKRDSLRQRCVNGNFRNL
jgi:hypothetical protein